MRKLAVLLIFILSISVLGATPKRPPAATTVAPETFPHPMALFLDGMSDHGTRSVTFRARALGVRFFFEDPTGVTVYRYDDGRYVREEVLTGVKMEKAVMRYAQK